jgi:hypothetical protein
MGLIGILLGLALLIGFAYRGWSVLLLTPVAALVAFLPLLVVVAVNLVMSLVVLPGLDLAFLA